MANGLVALSTAAVLAVYGIGYARTAPAASDNFTSSAPLVASASATATPTTPPATATTVPATATTAATSTTARSTNTATASSGSAGASQAPAIPATATRRATATATAAAAKSATQLRDGTYTGTGTSRHGSIGVSVVIQGGKIVSAEITNCGTRYPCSKIANLPDEVIAAQSANVDFVSGSTDSSKAYTSAVAAALAKAV
ncbi:MAG: FMN-binding protein [Thermomicrobiales bacterium]